MNKKIVGILICMLFIGTSFIPNINGKISDAANILNNKKIKNEETNTNINILTSSPKGPINNIYYFGTIELYTFGYTEFTYSPPMGPGNFYWNIAVSCVGDIGEVIANYTINPMFHSEKYIEVDYYLHCLIFIFNGEFDFDPIVDEDGGYLKGFGFLIILSK